jgi:hypothetical protein
MNDANPRPARVAKYYLWLARFAIFAPLVWWVVLGTGVLAGKITLIDAISFLGFVFGGGSGAVVCLAALTRRVPDSERGELFFRGAVGFFLSVSAFGLSLLLARTPC